MAGKIPGCATYIYSLGEGNTGIDNLVIDPMTYKYQVTGLLPDALKTDVMTSQEIRR